MDKIPSTDTIRNKLNTLGPGESFVYYSGFLDVERSRNPKHPVNIIAEEAHRLMDEGKIYLTQKRISPPVTDEGSISWFIGRGKGFDYIATGARLPREPMRIPQKPLFNPLTKVLK